MICHIMHPKRYYLPFRVEIWNKLGQKHEKGVCLVRWTWNDIKEVIWEAQLVFIIKKASDDLIVAIERIWDMFIEVGADFRDGKIQKEP